MKFAYQFSFLLVLPMAIHAQWNYPVTKTVDSADTYWGKSYHDPYRWLENTQAEEADSWFKAQATYTDSVMSAIPGAAQLVNEWSSLDKLKTAEIGKIIVAKETGRTFYSKGNVGDNVAKLYYRDSWDGKEKLLFDPLTYQPGKTTAIESFMPSPDGKKVILALTENGAEISVLRIFNVETKTFYPESVYPTWFAFGRWTPDSKSFVYTLLSSNDPKSPDLQLNTKAKLHILNTDSKNDIDFFSNASYPQLGIQPSEMVSAWIGDFHPDHIIASLDVTDKFLKYYYIPVSDVYNQKLDWKVLCTPADKLTKMGTAYYKDKMYAVTHNQNAEYRVICTDINHPDWSYATTVIEEQKDILRYITQTKDYLFAIYSDGINSRIIQYHFASGKREEVKLPKTGTVSIYSPDVTTNRTLIYITSWVAPVTLYEYDGETGKIKESVFNTTAQYPGFENIVVEEVEAPSYDGTMVPLTILHKKDLKLDGSHSCILEGYGAYGYSYSPYFDYMTNSIILKDVIWAIAHVRGGGEKGVQWHEGGRKTTKPNTWKDFIACGEYLVKKGYTSSSKLAGTGTSAGGILISRAITERPALFAAAVCNVGWANAMRIEFTPNGPSNAAEFGSVKDSAECMALYEMDGMMHVQKNTKYPAVMCVGGWNDARVSVWHPAKFAAALQNATSSKNPILMKVNYDNGHFTEDAMVTFKNFADQYAFMLWQTGHPAFQPKKN